MGTPGEHQPRDEGNSGPRERHAPHDAMGGFHPTPIGAVAPPLRCERRASFPETCTVRTAVRTTSLLPALNAVESSSNTSPAHELGPTFTEPLGTPEARNVPPTTIWRGASIST